MNAKERGFLLLTSQLGDLERKPLTVAQFRTLAMRVAQGKISDDMRELTEQDIIALGYDRTMAARMISLLGNTKDLDQYLKTGNRFGCVPISRISQEYPLAVHKRLGLDAPGCLWAKGNMDLLHTQTVSLVGCREISPMNYQFAEKAGKEAARQGITLVSGNARGADKIAQDACLAEGGNVICVVADELMNCSPMDNVLYISEDSFDLPFTPARALSRNRVIHTLGYLTLVAQSNLGTGGTWDGTVKNLKNHWNPVFCFDDGSSAARELHQLGATLICQEELTDFAALRSDLYTFLS